MELLNLADYELAAESRLPPEVWDYVAGGAEDETSLRENCRAFKRVTFRPRVLMDTGSRDLSVRVLDTVVQLPVLLAPTSPQRLVHSDAELAAARAAAAVGTTFCCSTNDYFTVEEVVEAISAPVWFQLYCYESHELTKQIVQRAESAGCSALIVTVDAVVLGRRERSLRRGRNISGRVKMGNLVGLLPSQTADRPLRRLVLTWNDIDWLKTITTLPLIVKGLLTKEDATLAVKHGADGIVVSNHGGRQLDGAVAPIEALPEIAEAVRGQAEVLLDGGIRRGTDALKALALGARAVLVGRPYLWGMAVDGEVGVRRVLEILREEIDNNLIQLGCARIADLSPSHVCLHSCPGRPGGWDSPGSHPCSEG